MRDITPANVLFRLNRPDTWSDHAVYERLGNPIRDPVIPLAAEGNNASAPQYLVEPAALARIDSSFLCEDVVLIDPGQAYISAAYSTHDTGTPLPYCAPELLFDSNASFPSHIWALACTLFAMRAGTPPFAAFFCSLDEILRQIVQTIGKLPEPWWSKWQTRQFFFEANGQPLKAWPNGIQLAVKYPLDEMIRDIGLEDDSPANPPQRSLMESPGTGLSESEAHVLEDLMRRSLNLFPERRISAKQVMEHLGLTQTS